MEKCHYGKMSLWKNVTMENDMSMYHYGKCHYGKRRGAVIQFLTVLFIYKSKNLPIKLNGHVTQLSSSRGKDEKV